MTIHAVPMCLGSVASSTVPQCASTEHPWPLYALGSALRFAPLLPIVPQEDLFYPSLFVAPWQVFRSPPERLGSLFPGPLYIFELGHRQRPGLHSRAVVFG